MATVNRRTLKRNLKVGAIVVAVAGLVLSWFAGIFPLVALSCLAMVGCDFFGVLLGVGEARGQEDVAGIGDVGGDFFGKYVLAGWSGSHLTDHGWEGWVCIVPILVTGFFTTKYVTRWARRIKQRHVEVEHEPLQSLHVPVPPAPAGTTVRLAGEDSSGQV